MNIIRSFSLRILPLCERASPVWVAVFASAILSLIAIKTSGTLNRDGMLYVDAARMFDQGGFNAAHKVFSWPFLSILMAVLSKTTGIGLETTGYLLNILFMAGACGLLVSCAARSCPEAAWPTCLVILAIPGLNDYRHELVREYGCWFFIMLSLWMALRWADAPRWRTALIAQAAILVASLFRPEAAAFLCALIAWQLVEAPASERWQRLTMIGVIPVVGFIVAFTLLMCNQLPSRLASDINRFNPERFIVRAQMIAPGLPEFARDNSGIILFFGSLAIIPLKFSKMMGIFLAPLLYANLNSSARPAHQVSQRLFAWAILVHCLILAIFVIDLHFLAGRYVALLALLATPLTGYGLHLIFLRFPRWKLLLILLAIVMALSNVISTGQKKQYFMEAGAWLATNATESPRVHNESARAAYYAGWRYTARPMDERAELPENLKRRDVDLVILEISRKESDISAWLASAGLVEIKRFSHPNGDAVVVAQPIYMTTMDRKK